MLLLLLLGGCLANTGGNFLSGGQKEAPAWVLSPPADTNAVLYGVGEGSELDEARLAALRDVAAKLRVSISASTDSQVNVSNNFVDRSSSSKVSEEVRKTTFAKHQLEKTEVYPHSVYALVSVDRQMLVNETKNRLDEKDRILRTGLDSARARTGLERLHIASQLKPVADDVVDLLSLMSSASQGFPRVAYTKQVDAWRQLNDDALRNLSFRLQFRPIDQDVANLLRQMLSESEYRIVEAGQATGVVQVSTESTYQSIYGSTQLQLKLHVSLRSEEGRVFSQKEYQVEGTSLEDRAVARQAAVRKLAGELKKHGTADVLGFNNAH